MRPRIVERLRRIRSRSSGLSCWYDLHELESADALASLELFLAPPLGEPLSDAVDAHSRTEAVTRAWQIGLVASAWRPR